MFLKKNYDFTEFSAVNVEILPRDQDSTYLRGIIIHQEDPASKLANADHFSIIVRNNDEKTIVDFFYLIYRDIIMADKEVE